MKNKQEAKYHHYVPQCYLKQWSHPELHKMKSIWIYSLKNKMINHNKYSEVLGQDYLYTQLTEKLFGEKIESRFRTILNQLEKMGDIRTVLDNTNFHHLYNNFDLDILIDFCIYTKVRSPSFLANIISMLSKDFFHKNKNIKKHDIHNIFMARYGDALKNEISKENVIINFYFINEKLQEEFITSDNPVIFTGSDKFYLDENSEQKIVFCLTNQDKFLFPLCPKILVEIKFNQNTWENNFCLFKASTDYDLVKNQQFVTEVNLTIINQSKERIVGLTRTKLLDYLKYNNSTIQPNKYSIIGILT